MTAAGVITVIFTIVCVTPLAWADWRQRRRARNSLPRRQRVTYAPAVPLTPDQEDELAALVFAFRCVNIPEPDGRSGR